MKVSELLLEKTLIKKPWKVDKVTLEDAIKLLNKHCQRSLNDIANGTVLWRGMGSVGKVAALDSTKAYRTSRDSNNLYQVAMEVSDNLKNIPPRSRSFICSNNVDTAESHGKLTYAIFPYDGTTIASIKSDDMFTITLPQTGGGVEDFSNGLQESLERLGIKPNEKKKYTSAKIIDDGLSAHDASIFLYSFGFDTGMLPKRACEMIIKDYNQLSRSQTIAISPTYITNAMKRGDLDLALFEKCIRKNATVDARAILDAMIAAPNKKFTALSSLMMRESTLKITLTQPGSLGNMKKDVECWFSGKCIVIEFKLFLKILLEMQKRNMRVGDSLRELMMSEYDLL